MNSSHRRSFELTRHGRLSLELKLQHALSNKDKAWFRTRVLFVFPQGLAVTEDRLGRARWYANLRSYIRPAPAPVSLAELAASPLYQDGAVEDLRPRRQRRLHRLHAYRLRRAIRAESTKILEDIQTTPGADFEGSLEAMAAARAPMMRYAKAASELPDSVRKVIHDCDEWTSLETSAAGLKFALALQRAGLPAPKVLERLIDVETAHRADQGYRSADLDPLQHGSELLVHLGGLKKEIGSALHLNLSTEHPSSKARDLGFAVAAAVAMLWAVGMQIVTWWYVGNPVSPDAAPSTLLTFTTVAVVAYAMKDRIKEGLRRWFNARIPEWLFDRRQVGWGDGDEQLAWADESTSFSPLKELPRGDREWVEGCDPPRGRCDAVVYQRTTTIRSPQLREGQESVESLMEIVRFALRPWLTHMDNLHQPVWHRDDHGVVGKTYCLRLYPVLVCIELDQPDGIERQAFRVVLSPKGIERIEPAAGTTA